MTFGNDWSQDIAKVMFLEIKIKCMQKLAPLSAEILFLSKLKKWWNSLNKKDIIEKRSLVTAI